MADFDEHRRSMEPRTKWTELSAKRLVCVLDKFATADDILEAIDKSIVSGWRAVFLPTGTTSNGTARKAVEISALDFAKGGS